MKEVNSTIQNAQAPHPAAYVEPAMLMQIKPDPATAFAVQCSLTVGSPDDPLEREADEMASRVMRMPKPGFIQRKCAHCQEEEKAQRKPLAQSITPFIQAKGEGAVAAGKATSAAIQSSRGSGGRMDSQTNSFMSSRFGADFSNVNIHTDNHSAGLNRDLNARAFTVGNDIYFNSGQYQPQSAEGKTLLAHELTHVVQQGADRIEKKIQRASYYSDITKGSATGIADFPKAYTILSPLNSTDMLETLDELENKHPNAILGLLSNLGLATGPVGVTRLKAYFLAFKNARYQNALSATELTDLVASTGTLPLGQQKAIQQYVATHRSAVSKDLYAGSKLPSAADQAKVETIFNPGATATVSFTGTVTYTPPTEDAVCGNTPAFTTKIRTVLEPKIKAGASAFKTKKLSPPAFPIAQANTMADLAQTEVETYFKPFLARASRSGAPGTYTLGGSTKASALLKDQSATTIWQTESGRTGWLKYWYDHHTGNMNDTLHCKDSNISLALKNMATDAALIPDIDDWVKSWPAEATGGINIQPYLDASNVVCSRWDTFTTIIHEFIHLLAHPNFRAAKDALPHNAMEILKEGFDDVLRKELWEGAGNLKNRLTSTSGTANRTIIEGGAYPLDTAKVCNHGYYGNTSDAEKVVSIVGRNNMKLAYFMGQTEYLGIGSGTTLTSGGSLATSSFYKTTDAGDIDHVAVQPGETREQLLFRTNGTEIRKTNNVILPSGEALPATVKIPGVRRVYVHTDDTLISIAAQNGVTPYEVMKANNLSATALTVGSRLIIPKH